ncbi:hypothetical protein ACFFP0_24170 [Rhizobium puerariae]|uniref:Uncharacterized protein n=1 Tax=Rhizobium puerariae TaxID=1585791 RepID=A0ABV6AMX6_9HYPH
MKVIVCPRALSQDLLVGMSDAEFDASLGKAVDQIFEASSIKI